MKMAAFAKRWIWLAAALALAVSGCGGGSKSATPPRASVDTETSTSSTPTVSESTTSTSVATPSTMPEQHFEPLYADPALTPEEQVEAAYLFYWDVVLDAFARGDDRYLPLVLVDGGLLTRLSELAELVDRGERYRIDVSHRHEILLVEMDEAVVADLQRSKFVTLRASDSTILDIEENVDVPWVYWLYKRGDQWVVYDFYVEQLP